MCPYYWFGMNLMYNLQLLVTDNLVKLVDFTEFRVYVTLDCSR